MKIEKKWREKLQLVTAFLFGTIFNLNMQNSLAQREFKMKKKIIIEHPYSLTRDESTSLGKRIIKFSEAAVNSSVFNF
jgi:hypothetical protein